MGYHRNPKNEDRKPHHDYCECCPWEGGEHCNNDCIHPTHYPPCECCVFECGECRQTCDCPDSDDEDELKTCAVCEVHETLCTCSDDEDDDWGRG